MEQWMIIPSIEDAEQSLDLAKRYGCGLEYNDFILGSVLDDPDELNVIVKQADYFPREMRRTMHGVFYDITIFSADPQICAVSEHRVRQSMEVAARLGVGGVVFHTNYIPTFRMQSYEDYWVEANKQFWTQIAQEYPQIEIYMENMFDLSPELLLRLAEEMRGVSRFGVCLDIAHAHLSEVPVCEWIAMLAPHIRHIHINDNDGITDGHLPLGEGRIAFEPVLGSIREHCKAASILIEVKGLEEQKKCFDYLQDRSLL